MKKQILLICKDRSFSILFKSISNCGNTHYLRENLFAVFKLGNQ